MRLSDWFLSLIGRRPKREQVGPKVHRGPTDHIVLLDGTMSTLQPGCETNVGLTYKLLQEAGAGAAMSIYYEAGLQWQDWRGGVDVMTGRGINRQIRRAYGALASRYRPGDRIFLLGYSRGAYAVRSLAGVIDRVGLLRSEFATVRHIREAYRYYQDNPDSDHIEDFVRSYCHPSVEIEMVGVWDTVKALGLRLPLLWRLSDRNHAFHNHRLGSSIRHGFHALALDENRVAYDPVLWACPPGWTGHVEQVWFNGCHGDVGGQLRGFEPARPLANVPLVWMLEKISTCGIALPDGWRARFPQDHDAPSAGNWRGLAMLFLYRRRRKTGLDPSERFYGETAPQGSEAETPPLSSSS